MWGGLCRTNRTRAWDPRSDTQLERGIAENAMDAGCTKPNSPPPPAGVAARRRHEASSRLAPDISSFLLPWQH